MNGVPSSPRSPRTWSRSNGPSASATRSRKSSTTYLGRLPASPSEWLEGEGPAGASSSARNSGRGRQDDEEQRRRAAGPVRAVRAPERGDGLHQRGVADPAVLLHRSG